MKNIIKILVLTFITINLNAKKADINIDKELTKINSKICACFDELENNWIKMAKQINLCVREFQAKSGNLKEKMKKVGVDIADLPDSESQEKALKMIEDRRKLYDESVDIKAKRIFKNIPR